MIYIYFRGERYPDAGGENKLNADQDIYFSLATFNKKVNVYVFATVNYLIYHCP